MGFSFRGKTSEQPIDVNETDAVSSGADVQTNPEVDLKKFRKLHTFDPYLDIGKLDDVDNVLATGDPEKEAVVEGQLLAEDSPYPEVRASVSSLITHRAFAPSNRIVMAMEAWHILTRQS